MYSEVVGFDKALSESSHFSFSKRLFPIEHKRHPAAPLPGSAPWKI